MCKDKILPNSVSGTTCNQLQLLGFCSFGLLLDSTDKERNLCILLFECLLTWKSRGFLLALKFPVAPSDGGKLTEFTVLKRSIGPSTQEGIVVALISLFFFHDKIDCCSLDGACNKQKWKKKEEKFKFLNLFQTDTIHKTQLLGTGLIKKVRSKSYTYVHR